LDCVTYAKNTQLAISSGALKPHGRSIKDRDNLIKSLQSGSCVDEIEQKTGFSRSHILKKKRELGLTKNQYNSYSTKLKAIKLIKKKKPYKEIAKLTGLKQSYLPKLAYKEGLSQSCLISSETYKSIETDLINENKMSMRGIAHRYNVSKTVVQDLNKEKQIRTKKVWRHLIVPV
jgi:uncharacterized protein YerC